MKTLLICLFSSLLWFGNSVDIQAQNADKLFQLGMMLEEGEGDLNKAIEIYSKLVSDITAERNIRANALLHVGICYEKLENPNSKKTYRKLISEYPDQDEVAAVGKLRLKVLESKNPILKPVGIVATQVWSPAKDTYGVSPNGRYLNYIDWNNISLNIKDLKKGTTRALSKTGTWKGSSQFPDNSIWSPDGKQIAYYWIVGKEGELHIVNFDGSSDRIIAKGKNGPTPWPVKWSPDGNFILAIKSSKEIDNSLHEIVLVSVDDGSVKSFKMLSDCGCYLDISPDNKYIVYTLPQKKGSKQKDIYIISMDGSVDKKIVSDTANDANPIWSNDGKEILFVSDRHGSNDLWKLKIKNGSLIGAAEIVKVNLGSKNKLLGMSKNGSVFYSTSNSRSDIFTVNLDDNSRADFKQPVKISKLEEKMNVNPIWSPDGRYVAYNRVSSFMDHFLGSEHLLTIFDTKTEEIKNIATAIYGAKSMPPTWSPDGKKMLFFGIIEKDLQAGIFSFDILSKEITPIKVKKNMPWRKADLYNSYAAYSKDGKSIYYLSEDIKRILKYDIKSNQETTIVTGEMELRYFKLSNDNSKIAFGNRFGKTKDIYIISTDGGEKKKILEADCKCSSEVLSWSTNDKYVYYKEGKFRNLKKIMRVSIEGGEPEMVFEFKEVFDSGIISSTNMFLDGDNKLLVELRVGKGMEVWKLDGIFNE